MKGSLRVHLHDFGGYAFAAELSRELVRRGVTVDHTFAAQMVNGKGRVASQVGDPSTLRFLGITASRAFEKYRPIGRVRFELSYARAWIAVLVESRPDVVVVSNTPLFAMVVFRRYARKARVPWVLWHQDILSLALSEEAGRKLPGPLARLAEVFVGRVERGNVIQPAFVVAIGEEFRRFYRSQWKLERPGISVIPNWAPLDEITPQPGVNRWAERWLPDRRPLGLLYAGTLGRKHNPGLLVDLMGALERRGVDAQLVVASEGEGADLVAARSNEVRSGAVKVIPFQPVEDVPEMLGSADVLVAILEPSASRFSIPSKVLTYLAAGRPILGLMPADNPAAVDIEAARGLVAPPTAAGIESAAEWLAGLAGDRERIADIGKRSRDVAEESFGIQHIADQFVAILEAAAEE